MHNGFSKYYSSKKNSTSDNRHGLQRKTTIKLSFRRLLGLFTHTNGYQAKVSLTLGIAFPV
jgi:hypothetical protein